MKINSTIWVALSALVLVIVVGVVSFNLGFSAGNESAQNIRAEFFQNRFGTQAQTGSTEPAQAGQAQRGQFGRVAANGTVKSVQGNKIEVTTSTGSVMVTVDSQTQIIKSVSAGVGDIQPGMRVAVTSDQTGSNVTARLITIQQRSE